MQMMVSPRGIGSGRTHPMIPFKDKIMFEKSQSKTWGGRYWEKSIL